MVNNFFVINDNLITTNLLIYNNHELITILSDYNFSPFFTVFLREKRCLNSPVLKLMISAVNSAQN